MFLFLVIDLFDVAMWDLFTRYLSRARTNEGTATTISTLGGEGVDAIALAAGFDRRDKEFVVVMICNF